MLRTQFLSRHKDNYHVCSLQELTEAKLAYLAGIIDGEGSFTVTTKSNTFGMMVGVTDRVLIEWLHREIGGLAYYDISQTTAKRLVHRWQISRHADLAYILPLLAPYLVIKRPQAEAMLRLVEHLQNYPRYDVPTSRSPQDERGRRRDTAQSWKEEGQRLRLAVRDARYPGFI